VQPHQHGATLAQEDEILPSSMTGVAGFGFGWSAAGTPPASSSTNAVSASSGGNQGLHASTSLMGLAVGSTDADRPANIGDVLLGAVDAHGMSDRGNEVLD